MEGFIFEMRELTRRQEIAHLIQECPRGFEELRVMLRCAVRTLEDDLRHIERSARRTGGRLRVSPPECLDCGFEFRGREGRHFHPPSRCPRCRSENILDPTFHLPP
jgi:predicted Zn-ribbon and HTH transcriptional regulator